MGRRRRARALAADVVAAPQARSGDRAAPHDPGLAARRRRVDRCRACGDGSGHDPRPPDRSDAGPVLAVLPTSVRGAGGPHLHRRGVHRPLGRLDVRRVRRRDGRGPHAAPTSSPAPSWRPAWCRWRVFAPDPRPARRPLRAAADRHPVLPLVGLLGGHDPARPRCAGWPAWLLFITFPLCGAIPNLGTMARARWSHIFAHDPQQPARGDVVRAGHGGGHLRHRPGPRDLALDDALPRGGLRSSPPSRYAVGVLVFISARSTEPPVVPHHERPTEHAYTVPGLVPLAFIMVMTGAIFGVNEVVTLAVSQEPGRASAAGAILALYRRRVGRRRPRLRPRSRTAATSSSSSSRARFGMAVLEVPVLFARQPLGPRRRSCSSPAWRPRPTLITTMNLIERIVPKAQLNEGMTIVLTGLIIGIAAGSAVSGVVIDRVGAAARLLGRRHRRAASPSSWRSARGPSSPGARWPTFGKPPHPVSGHVQRVPAQRHTAAVCR